MLIFMGINTCNIAVSYCLVYGVGPFPQMGVTGVVTGTFAARVVGAVLLAVVLLRGQSGIRVCWSLLAIVRAHTWRILRIGLPAAVDGIVMWTAQMFYLAIISRLADGPLGEAYLAAHIVAVRVEALTYLPAVAVGISGSHDDRSIAWRGDAGSGAVGRAHGRDAMQRPFHRHGRPCSTLAPTSSTTT